MEATFTLLDLAGYIAMLLWGLHMVQSGIMQAFGANIHDQRAAYGAPVA